jgi:hypothetical protein
MSYAACNQYNITIVNQNWFNFGHKYKSPEQNTLIKLHGTQFAYRHIAC